MDSGLCDVGRWLYAEHGHSKREEMLKQIAIITGKLHHETVAGETKREVIISRRLWRDVTQDVE